MVSSCRCRLGQSPPSPSLARDCCAPTDPGPLCSAVDWPSLCSQSAGLRVLSTGFQPRSASCGWSRLCQSATITRYERSAAVHRSGQRTRSSKIGPVKPHARDWANLRRHRRCRGTAVPRRTLDRSAARQIGTVLSQSADFVFLARGFSPAALTTRNPPELRYNSGGFLCARS